MLEESLENTTFLPPINNTRTQNFKKEIIKVISSEGNLNDKTEDNIENVLKDQRN